MLVREGRNNIIEGLCARKVLLKVLKVAKLGNGFSFSRETFVADIFSLVCLLLSNATQMPIRNNRPSPLPKEKKTTTTLPPLSLWNEAIN